MTDITGIDDIDQPALDEYALDESVMYRGIPGSGKTTTSLGRIARIIESDDLWYELQDVCWITYRRALADDALDTAADVGVVPDAAASDIQARLQSDARWWGTVHAVALRSLTRDTEDGWDSDDITIVSEAEQETFARDVLGVEYSDPTPWRDGIGALIFDCINWCRRNLIDPSDPGAPVEECPAYDDLMDRWGGDLQSAARKWERFKSAAADSGELVIDYPDLLEMALDGDVLAPPTSVLMIDEYHDAYPLLAAVCEKWMQSHDIVIVAADPAQTINAYRGADPDLFRRLDLPEIDLSESRRVPREHYAAALSVLSGAQDPPAVTPAGTGTLRELSAEQPVTRDDDTGRWDAPDATVPGSPGDVHERMRSAAAPGDEMMHLVRTQRQGAAVAAALDAAGVAYRSQGEIPDWVQRDARRAVYNVFSAGEMTDVPHGDGHVPADEVQVARSAAKTAVRLAPREYLDLHKPAVRDIRGEELDDDDDLEYDLKTVADLDGLVSPGFWQPLDDASRLREWTGFAEGGGAELTQRDVEAVRARLRRRGVGDRVRPRSIDATLRTIHASKGTEADHVAVYTGATQRIIDSMDESHAELENEHRVWYVGLTRSSESLYVVHDVLESMQEMPERGPDLRGVEQVADAALSRARSAAAGGDADA